MKKSAHATNDAEDILRQAVYDRLKDFQQALLAYRQHTGGPASFLIQNAAPEIPPALLQRCVVLPNRDHIIAAMPKDGVVVEVGTQTGQFARKIVDLASPRKLYLIDMDYGPFQRRLLTEEISSGRVELIEGVSWDMLARFKDESFDFTYVDAGHGYDMVKKDLAQALKKTKRGGYIVCNDFSTWSPLEAIPYGVHQAVCELVVEHSLAVTHFAFHRAAFFDVALRRPL